MTIPADLKEELSDHGCLEQFDGQSFTIKKEAVVSVITAKREETRRSRIEKIIRALRS